MMKTIAKTKTNTTQKAEWATMKTYRACLQEYMAADFEAAVRYATYPEPSEQEWQQCVEEVVKAGGEPSSAGQCISKWADRALLGHAARDMLSHEEESDAIELRVRAIWKKDAALLIAAAKEIEGQLQHFKWELENEDGGFFACMPPHDDDFEYVWDMFLGWGLPNTWGEETLSSLSQDEVLAAFAYSCVTVIRYFLSKRSFNWSTDDARYQIHRALVSAWRTLAVLEARPHEA